MKLGCFNHTASCNYFSLLYIKKKQLHILILSCWILYNNCYNFCKNLIVTDLEIKLGTQVSCFFYKEMTMPAWLKADYTNSQEITKNYEQKTVYSQLPHMTTTLLSGHFL